jgi:hypothetical protein
LERSELEALAAGLPEGWCVVLVPPHGQVSITPIAGNHWYHDAMIVARDGRSGPARVHRMR